MKLIIVESITFVLYLGLFIYAWKRLSQGHSLNSKTLPFLVIAISVHGYLSYLHIDGGIGQNLGLFNIFNATMWLAMCLVTWNVFRHQANSLLLVSLPIAAVSVLEVAFFSGSSPISLAGKTVNLLHIFTAIAAMSILMLAALQSLLVLYLDHSLKRHPAQLNPWLGSLQGMERYLIQLLTTGFTLMSVTLLLVLLLPTEVKSSQAMHKILLTLSSWIVLAWLMFGSYVKGWRGVFAAKWSLVGILLLLVGYFGSKLVVEFIL